MTFYWVFLSVPSPVGFYTNSAIVVDINLVLKFAQKVFVRIKSANLDIPKTCKHWDSCNFYKLNCYLHNHKDLKKQKKYIYKKLHCEECEYICKVENDLVAQKLSKHEKPENFACRKC